MSSRTRADSALALFINIPDSVLIALSHDRQHRTAILESPLPFSDDLFTHLFHEAHADTGKGSLKLLQRRLSPAQRRLVLENDTREVALEDLLDCNILSSAELDLVLGCRHPDWDFDTPVAEKLFHYYIHDEVVLKKLHPHLDEHYRARATMCSPAPSDSDVLRALETWLADLEFPGNGGYDPSNFITDLEVTLYLRPHLATQVARYTNGYVHCALSGLRHAAASGVLRQLTADHHYEIDALQGRSMESQVTEALKINIFLPPVLSPYGTYSVYELPVPYDLVTLKDPVQLERALRYATASYDPFKRRPVSYWEIYDLARNDNVVDRKDHLGRRWDGHLYAALVKDTATEQLGPVRVSEALHAITERFDVAAEAHSYAAPLPLEYTPETATRLVTPGAIELMPWNLNDPVDVVRQGRHLDATVLLPFLEDSPGHWTRFLQYLDLASSGTPLAKVAATAAAAAS